jgi:hypothetical protein
MIAIRYALPAIAALLILAAGCESPSALGTKSAEAVKAADDFVALAKDSATTGVVPRETDPEVKKLLDAVFDTSVLQSGPVQPMSEIQPINDWNLAGSRWVLSISSPAPA